MLTACKAEKFPIKMEFGEFEFLADFVPSHLII